MTSCIGHLPDSKVTQIIQVPFWSLMLHCTSGGADSENGLDGQHSQLANPAKGSPLGGWNIDPDSLTALAILVTPEAL